MKYYETILACLTAVALFDCIKMWFRMAIDKRNALKPPPPRGGDRSAEILKDFIGHLQKNNVPFEIIKGPNAGDNCPCPICIARRESEKKSQPGGSDGRTLH